MPKPTSPAASDKKPAAAKKPAAGFAKPVQPDAALAAVVGSTPLPRTELTKKLWEYIRENKLQDPAKKSLINADDKLRAVFDGKAQVSRLEDADYEGHSLAMLKRIAGALDQRVEIHFVPVSKKATRRVRPAVA